MKKLNHDQTSQSKKLLLNLHGNFKAAQTAVLLVLITLATPVVSKGAIVAYWNFDNDYSATVGGSDFDLQAIGNAGNSTVESVFGGSSAYFDGNGDYFFTDSGSGNMLDRNSDFSYSAWFYLDVSDIIGSSRYFIMESTIGDEIGGIQSHPISLGLRDLGGTDVVQVYTSVDNKSDRYYQWDTSPNQQWHNIITTYDASTGTLTSYFNGVEVGSAAVPIVGVNGDEQPTTSNNDIGNGLVIGGHRGGIMRNWQGYIDDVAVWDEVIGASEIARLQSNPVAVPEIRTIPLVACVAAMGFVLIRRKRRCLR